MKNTFRIFLFLLMALLASLPVGAAPPKTLSYQGVLTNSAAVPVNGGQSIVFSLYAASTGGAALWSETQSVTASNGMFAVTLGGITPIALPFDATYYLGVKVGADAEMLPRQPLAASAYAITALRVDATGSVPGSTVVGPISAAPAQFQSTIIGAGAAANATGDQNTVLGADALKNVTIGSNNVAIGPSALLSTQSGVNNTAIGRFALGNLSSGTNNIAIGTNAGSSLTTGDHNIFIQNEGIAGDSKTIRIGEPFFAPFRAFIQGIRGVTPASTDVLPVIIDVNGQLGTAATAPVAVREPGAGNTFAGTGAGNAALAGEGNIAFGKDALPVVTSGIWNAATGFRAMLLNQGGSFNTANGLEALANNVSGSNNTAVGVRALLNSTAGGNIAIGANAGASLTAGGGNIAIDHVGVAAEANTTRIGTGQTRAFIAGISGVNVSGVNVLVNSSGQLGVAVSSRRFKENIASMSDASADLMRLNPVTFNYLDGQDDGQKLTQYGLIAEEVAEVYPDLVVKTPDGKAETVRYHFLTPMLLNEVQKQQRVIQSQTAHIASQAARIEALEKQSLRMAALLEKLDGTPMAQR